MNKSFKRTKLQRVTIRGYKSIDYDRPLSIELSDINILLGANGAGKSNIISFFRMLNYMMSGTLQKYVAEKGPASTLLYYGSKTTPAMEGSLEFSNGEINDFYNFSLAAAAGQKLIITDEKLTYSKVGEDSPFECHIESNYQESGLVHAQDKTSKTVRRMLAECKAYQFHDSSQNGFLRQPSKEDSAQYLQSEGNNLASFLLFLKQKYNHEYSRIVEYVQMIMPSFGDFYLEPNSRGYVALNWTDNAANDYVFTADQFSDGTIRFIALATLLLQPEKTMPSVIIIDEPELGLHPYAIDQLAEMIKDASLHAQILISTQSQALINCFSVDCVTVIEQCDDTHATLAKKLNIEELSAWLEHYSLSELWYKNVIGGLPL